MMRYTVLGTLREGFLLYVIISSDHHRSECESGIIITARVTNMV